MRASTRAKVREVEYSLSELIEWERIISDNGIPGVNVVGVWVAVNRVKVGFTSEAMVSPGITAIQQLGVPAEAVYPEVYSHLSAAGTWEDYREVTFAGIQIALHGAPGWPSDTQYIASHGFNVRLEDRPGQPTWFLISAHVLNGFYGRNGASSNPVPIVWQPLWSSNQGNYAMGDIVNNPPWPSGGVCGNDNFGNPVDYCTAADAALGRPAFGLRNPSRAVGTSVTEGHNGNPGSQNINNLWPITNVLEPEYAWSAPRGTHKSGQSTGTTTGIQGPTCVDAVIPVPWGPPPVGTRRVKFFCVSEVLEAGWGLGDSGGAVFMQSGTLPNSTCGPYCALGMVVGGDGELYTSPPYPAYLDKVCKSGEECKLFYQRFTKIDSVFRPLVGRLNPRTY
jgi:hypothetical protein